MKAEVYYDNEGKDIREEEIPENMRDLAEEYRQKLVEAAADEDEAIMEKYLEGEEISEEELKRAIRKGTIANTLVPVCCGTSYRNKGVQPLLNAIVDYMPSPLDIPPAQGTSLDGEETIVTECSDDAPFAALAFKIVADPYVGKLAFFRVYSGTLKAGTYIYNASKNKRERIGRILLMHAASRTEIEEAHAGDIAALVGLKDTGTGDTLCDEKHPLLLETMEFPDPVIQVAIEPKKRRLARTR